ncbi:hypothetical protein GALL_78810 [mine drainage metagenome]|uniref:Uncharacterized protein n=1 Tax=mine drainage metagenome TaxID=410659 RepID=A0A1J5SNB2_9ZZZZ
MTEFLAFLRQWAADIRRLGFVGALTGSGRAAAPRLSSRAAPAGAVPAARAAAPPRPAAERSRNHDLDWGPDNNGLRRRTEPQL